MRKEQPMLARLIGASRRGDIVSFLQLVRDCEPILKRAANALTNEPDQSCWLIVLTVLQTRINRKDITTSTGIKIYLAKLM